MRQRIPIGTMVCLDEDKNVFQFLVEEYDYDVGRGRIARLKVDKKSKKIVECTYYS